MAKISKKPVPLRLRKGGKSDVRAQVAALCYRFIGEKLQVCIITTRDTGRWIIPRGWPMDGQTPAEGAAIEALEEAGVRGLAHPFSVGAYSYEKLIDDAWVTVMVTVFALQADKSHKKWPEKSERKRKWMSPKKAAQKLDDIGLRQIVAHFNPVTLDIARGA